MTDLVIPLSVRTAWGEYEELRFALRSAERYVPDLRQAYVIGPRKPAWLAPECHREHPDPYRSNKDANLIQKVLRACLIPGLSDPFIRMSDDQLFLGPWSPERWYLEPLAPEIFSRSPRKWYARLRNTAQALAGLGWELFNYDAHIPAPTGLDFARIVSHYAYGADPGMCINTLYMNHNPSGGRALGEGVRMGVSAPLAIESLRAMAAKALFCNYVDKGINDHFKYWLMETFPEPSRFER